MKDKKTKITITIRPEHLEYARTYGNVSLYIGRLIEHDMKAEEEYRDEHEEETRLMHRIEFAEEVKKEIMEIL